MSSYVLSPHVHACVTADYAIILDLRRDAYLALGAAQLPALQALIADWPQGQNSCRITNTAAATTDTDQLATELRARNLITPDPSQAIVRDITTYHRPVRALLEPQDTKSSLDSTGLRSRADWGFASRFAWSYAKALYQLKARSLEHAVTHFRRRRLSGCGPDARDAHALVACFTRLRTFVYTKSDACLVDSVTLMHFLSSFGIRPVWVLGVATGPFAAHSWVQLGDAVLNDTIEHVSQFVPILVV
jgi:hypothetical protein